MKSRRHSGVIVKCDNKVLLCKRNNFGSLPGEWSIPGGGIEKNETPIDCAFREFYEETDLKLETPLTLCGIIKRYTRDGKTVKGYMYTFFTEVEKEIHPDLFNAKDGQEHTQCGYYSYEDLPTPIGEQTKKLIKSVLFEKNTD